MDVDQRPGYQPVLRGKTPSQRRIINTHIRHVPFSYPKMQNGRPSLIPLLLLLPGGSVWKFAHEGRVRSSRSYATSQLQVLCAWGSSSWLPVFVAQSRGRLDRGTEQLIRPSSGLASGICPASLVALSLGWSLAPVLSGDPLAAGPAQAPLPFPLPLLPEGQFGYVWDDSSIRSSADHVISSRGSTYHSGQVAAKFASHRSMQLG